ncbi:hypothetical protein BDZ89DRAFT_1054853 [Hymenopellis radicata]|nr:hypothetical protein BDZ89DRAFT_1054853 [Hymenopellis radicata]
MSNRPPTVQTFAEEKQFDGDSNWLAFKSQLLLAAGSAGVAGVAWTDVLSRLKDFAARNAKQEAETAALAASTSSSAATPVICGKCGKKGKAPEWYKAKGKKKKTPDTTSTDANTVTTAAETYILATAIDERDVRGFRDSVLEGGVDDAGKETNNAVYTPALSHNLVSLSTLDMAGYRGSWGNGKLVVHGKDSKTPILEGVMFRSTTLRKMYSVDVLDDPASSRHVDVRRIEEMASKGLVVKTHCPKTSGKHWERATRRRRIEQRKQERRLCSGATTL